MIRKHFNLLPIYIVVAIDAFGTGILAPILAEKLKEAPQFFNLFKNSVFAEHVILGVVLALTPLCFMIGSPIIGYLSDKFGRKKVLTVCLIGSNAAYLLYLFAFRSASVLILLFARIVDGLGSASQSVGQAVAVENSDNQRDSVQKISYIAIAMTIGLVVGPLIGGVLSNPKIFHLFSEQTPFLVCLFIGVFNLILLLFTFKEEVVRRSESPLRDNWRRLFSNQRTTGLLVIFFGFELAWSLYFQSLALYLAQHFLLGKTRIGFVLSGIGLLLSFFLPIASKALLVKFSRFFSQCLGAFFLILGLFFVAESRDLNLFYLGSGFVVLATAILYPILVGEIAGSFSDKGFILGASDAVLALAFSITGFLSGWLNYYSARLPFYCAIGFIIFSTCFLISYQRKKQFCFHPSEVN